jgi:DNA-binding FrmR family transcriptional regulator
MGFSLHHQMLRYAQHDGRKFQPNLIAALPFLTGLPEYPIIQSNPPPGGMGNNQEESPVLSEAKNEALKRLNYIEGHLSGIRKMLEEDKYCVDILKQTFAVRRAIEKMESILLEGHLQTCAVEGIKGGREQEIVAELKDLYILANK